MLEFLKKLFLGSSSSASGSSSASLLTPSLPSHVQHLTLILQQTFNNRPNEPTLKSFIRQGRELFGRHGITNTPKRLAFFLATLDHESNGLSSAVREENLNYTAKRIAQVWPNRFPNEDAARPYEHNPTALANKVYGGRMGNTGPNDGWLYRGRGAIQITGRANYEAIGKICDLPLADDPGMAAEAEYIPQIACAYWTMRNVNRAADRDDFLLCTRLVNGGLTGIADRTRRLTRVESIIAGLA